jgi:hypothetical protein
MEHLQQEVIQVHMLEDQAAQEFHLLVLAPVLGMVFLVILPFIIEHCQH